MSSKNQPDFDKMLNFSMDISLFANKSRVNIAEVLIKNKEPMNITELHKKILKDFEKITYKVVAENVKMLETAGFIKSRVIKTTKGKQKILEPTEKMHDVIGLLFTFKKHMI